VRYRCEFQADPKDFASGAVIIHGSGRPAYPARLAQEIFLRCREASEKKDNLVVYDPCCGSAHLLTVLGFLNYGIISCLAGSDSDNDALVLAKSNLALLSRDGLEERKRRLAEMAARYGKESHRDALASADRLGALAAKAPKTPQTRLFGHDILAFPVQAAFTADIVIADAPHGLLSHWNTVTVNAVDVLLENLRSVLSPRAVIAVSTDKSQKIRHSGFKRVEQFNAGKRRVTLGRLE